MSSVGRGPDRHYAADGYSDGRLSAPAALRNREAIASELAAIAPERGQALEIASGTGEHVVLFAKVMPGLTWQPTDPAPERRASISAWAQAEGSKNVLAPVDLDACSAGWAERHGPADLIFLANLLHLVPEDAAKTCIAEICLATAPGGLAAIYGPFLRNGTATSEGDAKFDARIRSEIPGAGYKDRDWVEAQLAEGGMTPMPARDMPANNLILMARKPA